MEPQLPTPYNGPENAPKPADKSGELFAVPTLRGPEAQPIVEQGKESRETFVDNPPASGLVAVASTPPPLPVIDPVVDHTTNSSPPIDDTNPAVAADDDLIEKEWVEKAKKVVAETRNDPHAQDEAVSRLQADYLQKRYGKSVKLSSDG